MKISVNTKEELKAAVKQQADVIMVSDKLAKELKPIFTIMKLPRKKIAMIITFLTVSGAALIASIPANLLTLGIPLPTLIAMLGSAPAILGITTATGVSIPTIVALIAIAAGLGLSITVMILGYDMKAGPGGITLTKNN